MKKIFIHLAIGIGMLSVLFSVVQPVYADKAECTDGKECGPIITCTGNNCDFAMFMKMINNIISFLLFTLAPIFATITIAWGGFLILTSGGNSGKVSTAKKMMWNVAVGYLIALSAWLIVKLIFSTDLVEQKFLFFLE